ncbi:phosphoglycerate kinase [Candidatus Microgenomates bacterium]|nr:phosphoglycerate kinase [Candidatus Microgenomates bacterium]
MTLPIVTKENIAGKKVLVRGDIDVPITDGKITDDTRLLGIKSTIDFLLENNAEVILCGHVGRPKNIDLKYSTKPIQDYFPKIKVLENLRFDPREESNDLGFAQELASVSEVFINESFAESYREVASISGVAKLLPHFAGFRLAKEVEILSKVMDNPDRPMLVIIGGAKLDTKLPVINKMATVADNVIVGGKLLQDEPTENLSANIHLLELTADTLDTKSTSIDVYKNLIANAATIVWNGPLGMVEDFTYQIGTRRMAELVAHNETAYKVLGGGDTVGFINKLGLTDKFSWISSGGGSMLSFLSGEKLSGIEVLMA